MKNPLTASVVEESDCAHCWRTRTSLHISRPTLQRRWGEPRHVYISISTTLVIVVRNVDQVDRQRQRQRQRQTGTTDLHVRRTDGRLVV